MSLIPDVNNPPENTGLLVVNEPKSILISILGLFVIGGFLYLVSKQK